MKKFTKKIKKGSQYEIDFSYTQKDVDAFAKISGDLNPLHTDFDYASNSIFGKRIIHGYLGTSIFSKVFAMDFPGEGTIYLKQELIFYKPMFTNEIYKAIFIVLRHEESKNRAVVQTNILNSENKIIVKGEAYIQNAKYL